MPGLTFCAWQVPVNVAAVAVGLLLVLSGATLTIRVLGGVALATGALALAFTVASAVTGRRDGGVS